MAAQDEAARTPPRDAGDGVARLVRWGCYSIALNVALAVLHGAVAAASGSLAVTTELIHNAVDLLSAVVVVLGLRLARHKAKAFPYGLYKVENLVAAGIAVMIFATAYEVARTAFLEPAADLQVDPWMLGSLAVSMAMPLVFSHFELRVARAANSPALIADAREYRVHAYTTGLALVALLFGWFDLPFDRIAALIIVAAIVKTGWDLLLDALRVLLDASLDAKSLREVGAIIAADPAVAELKWTMGRNAGRFRFVEAGVTLRAASLAKVETAVQRIEARVRAAIPQIERVLLHVEGRALLHEKIAVPLADDAGTISEHFGEAPCFAFVTMSRSSGAIEEQVIRPNRHRAEERAKGIRVAEWLVAEKVDRVFTPKPLEGKGPSYVFQDAGIEVQLTDASRLADLLARRTAGGAATKAGPP